MAPETVFTNSSQHLKISQHNPSGSRNSPIDLTTIDDVGNEEQKAIVIEDSEVEALASKSKTEKLKPVGRRERIQRQQAIRTARAERQRARKESAEARAARAEHRRVRKEESAAAAAAAVSAASAVLKRTGGLLQKTGGLLQKTGGLLQQRSSDIREPAPRRRKEEDDIPDRRTRSQTSKRNCRPGLHGDCLEDRFKSIPGYLDSYGNKRSAEEAGFETGEPAVTERVRRPY